MLIFRIDSSDVVLDAKLWPPGHIFLALASALASEFQALVLALDLEAYLFDDN